MRYAMYVCGAVPQDSMQTHSKRCAVPSCKSRLNTALELNCGHGTRFTEK